jgi:hypothetical protein
MSSPFMLKVTVVEARNLKAHTFGGGRDVFRRSSYQRSYRLFQNYNKKEYS